MRFKLTDLVNIAQAMDSVEQLKQELAEFAADLDLDGSNNGVLEYLEIATGDAFNVPFDEAIAYFRAKGLQPTFSYQDMIGRAHDHAFTVAKMMDVDMLKQVKESLESALANGEAFSEWKKGIVPILKSGGWWGESLEIDPLTGKQKRVVLGSAWRLQTIFRTNMQSAYAAGQWEQIKQQANIAPYVMYDAVDDFRTRPAHRALDGTILPATDKFWLTHTPPLGWNCRCGVIQLDEAEMRAYGLSIKPPPVSESYQWTNPRNGEQMMVPEGVDPGFGRSLSDIAADSRELLLQKASVLSPEMAAALANAIKRDLPGVKLDDELAVTVSRLRIAQTAYTRVFNQSAPDPFGVDPLTVAIVLEQAIVDNQPLPAAYDWRNA